MREKIIECTESALHSVTALRYFKSERGYAARFYCALLNIMEDERLVDGDRLLEMEYQKGQRHGMYQRPDIIFHVPVETSHATERDNNYAVWAFKLEGYPGDAKADFTKLDEMFEHLNYPLGFFVNIGSSRDHLEHYEGPFSDRLVGVAIWIDKHQIRYTIRPVK